MIGPSRLALGVLGARLIASALAWAAIGFALTLGVAAFVPLALGMHTSVVRSGSMTPAIDTGDLVVSRTIHPTRAHVGDVVMFDDPNGSGEVITHRVRALHERNGSAHFVTRGDANTAFEHWSVPESGRIGRVAYRIPKLGFVIGGVASPPGKIFLIVIPAVLLLAVGLLRIWRPERLDAGGGREVHS